MDYGEAMGADIHQLRLRGRSGNLIRPTRLRKGAENKSRNSSLYGEYIKLRWLHSHGLRTGLFRVPELYDFSFDDDGVAYYEMDFIDGEPLTDVGRLIDIVDSMRSATHDNGHVSAKEYLERKLQYFAIGFDVPEHNVSSMCHGDLTTENVIVYQDELYLIDALPNDYETWYWDAAKVMQTAYGWNYINNDQYVIIGELIYVPGNPYTESHARLASRSDYDWWLLAIYSLAVYVRILPYARHAKERAALIIVIEELRNRVISGERLNEPLTALRW